MIVRRFLLWAQTACTSDRAEGIAVLVKAYLYSPLSPAERREALSVLTAFLDDPSPVVRRSLAVALADAADAPLGVMVALANDQPEIAAIVLARSPVLGDADLVDCAAMGEPATRTAIATRPYLSPPVCAALAEIAEAEVLVALAANAGAEINDAALMRMVERFGGDAALREVLLARPALPVAARQALAQCLAKSLLSLATSRGWMHGARGERITGEARERATIAMALASDEPEALLDHLRTTGQLTAGFLLRALLSGAVDLVECAFASLSGVGIERASALATELRPSAFRGLYRMTGMPEFLMPAFAAGFRAMRGRPLPQEPGTLSAAGVTAVMAACATLDGEAFSRLHSLVNRFAAEAAREEARIATARIAEEAALQLTMEMAAPELLLPEPAINDDESLDTADWDLRATRAA